MNPLIMVVIIFIILVIVLGIIMRFVKKVVRIVIITAIIILVVGSSLYVLKDANDLRKNFLQKEKLLMLDLDGKITAAVISKDVSVPAPVIDVKNLNQLYAEKKYSAMMEDKYKLIAFDWNAFRNIDFVGEDEYTFSMDNVREIMVSDYPKRILVDKMAREQGEKFRDSIAFEVDDMFPTDDHLKAVIFSFMIEKFSQNKAVFSEYADGNVFIYPETITLKLIKMLPRSWMKGFLPE